MPYTKKWLPWEDELLRHHYPHDNKDFLTEHIDRSWSAIKQRATKHLHIQHTRKYERGGDLSVFLNDTPHSAYWLGFIYADGSFSNGNSINLSTASKDLKHLTKYAKFIKFKKDPRMEFKHFKGNRFGSYKVWVTDPEVVYKIMDRFGFSRHKKYTPMINLPFDDCKLNFCFFIGLIDGDGSIYWRKDRKCISISSHKNHEEFLRKLVQNVYDQMGETKTINIIGRKRDDEIITNIYGSKLIKNIKMIASNYDLPYMERKWDKIPFCYTQVKNNKLVGVFQEGF